MVVVIVVVVAIAVAIAAVINFVCYHGRHRRRHHIVRVYSRSTLASAVLPT